MLVAEAYTFERGMSFLGVLVFLGICYLLSENRGRVSLRLVLVGLGLQILFAVLVLGLPVFDVSAPLRFLFDGANSMVLALLGFTEVGSRFLFGSLMDQKTYGVIFAFHVLPTIIFMASLMAVLYHLKVMPRVIGGMGWLMRQTMGTSGPESLAAAANVFVGQTEAPLAIKPYLPHVTRSELFCIMVSGMATVAGGVLTAYVALLKDMIPDIGGHLLTASFMSAPASLVIAKLLIPEIASVNSSSIKIRTEPSVNSIEAAAMGAADGLKLALNVAAMLLAFIALIALMNTTLGSVGRWMGSDHLMMSLNVTPRPLDLSFILGLLFWPFAVLMGIPLSEAMTAGFLLGEKVVLNEFVAYLHLARLQTELSERSMIILSYALCGFANFSSVAIQVGGIGSLAPDRRSEIAALGMKSVMGGTLAAFMTAAIAGIFV